MQQNLKRHTVIYVFISNLKLRSVSGLSGINMICRPLNFPVFFEFCLELVIIAYDRMDPQVEGYYEIQPELGSHSNTGNSESEVGEVKEIHMEDQLNGKQEMKRPRSQMANQIAPLGVVPYPNGSTIPVGSAPTPAPKVSRAKRRVSLGKCMDCLSLLLFLLHIVIEFAAVGYLGYLGIRAALRKGENKFHIEYWYPQLEAAAAVGLLFSCLWQAVIRRWPNIMVKGVLWSSPVVLFAASIILISSSHAASVGFGVVLLIFSISEALYACWVTPRLEYAEAILSKALAPTMKMLADLHQPSYWTIMVTFLWISVWNIGIVGAIHHEYAALIVLGLLVSFGWTLEVLRNVVNVTVSRVMALFYFYGMQSDMCFSFHRALTASLGSISLGSVMVPLLEALRVIARALNLVEGEDEFLFSCAHCCLRVMQAIFRFGNNWAFVQVATNGDDFMKASQDTWDLFQARGLEPVINLDLTSSICFLSGVTCGALCIIATGSWTFATHRNLTATISLISFFIGYFMTRITMAMPQACVCAYYVCYARNPQSRHFDSTIPDRIKHLEASMV